MTLVDSSALAEWRANQDWGRVKKNLNQVVAFKTKGIAPHELPAALKALGQRIAIVTTSPKWYADEIIRRFNISHDVLISYGDTKLHKPDPEPLNAALAVLKVAPEDAYHVGDASIDVEASYHAGVVSIGAGWGVANRETFAATAPDILIQTPSRMLNLDGLSSRGYFAELTAKGIAPLPHRGSVLPCGTDPRRYALGRYFTSGDPRHAKSSLSLNLLTFKEADTPAPSLATAFAHFLKQIEWVPEIIIPVPPKPSQSRHRFQVLLDRPECIIPNKVKVHLDGLTCIKEIGNYKTLGPGERATAIKGAFVSKRDWGGARVLLIDDVLTTGGTSAECARVLMSRGASEVRILAFGRDQLTFSRKNCPLCERPMRVRKQGKTGEVFWGCTGYPKHCQHTVPI